MANKHPEAAQVEQKLLSAFHKLRSKSRLLPLLRSLFILATGVTAMLFVEHLLYLDVATKTTVLLLLVLAALWSFWKDTRAYRQPDFESFYRHFSRYSHIPELKDSLDLEKKSDGNPALINAAILHNLGKIEASKLNESLRQYTESSPTSRQFKHIAIFTALSLAIATTSALNFNPAFERVFAFWQSFEQPNPYVFTVQPGNITLEQGSQFQAEIEFEGKNIPDKISLYIKTEAEDNFRQLALTPSSNSFQSAPFALHNNLEYFVQMGKFKSETFEARVQLRPRFARLSATIIPPAYTLLDTLKLNYPFSQINAYEGSEIIITGNLNKEISHLNLKSSQELPPVQVNARDVELTFELLRADTLRFEITDTDSLKNNNPFQLILSPRKDNYPVVEILEPAQSIERINPKTLALLYRASDDFQLSGAVFHYELKRAFVQQPQSGQIRLPRPTNGAVHSFNWPIDSLVMKPQDVLTFWIEVQDNDAFNGFKSSLSQKLTLTIPSLVNFFEDIDEKETEVGTTLEEVAESFSQMEEQYELFKEKMKETPDQIGYEQSQQLEEVRRQQEEVQQQIEELNKKFEEIKNEINESNMLSDETRQAYEELQQLMQEIDDPAFLETLQLMQEQLQSLSPEQLRQAMDQLEFNEALYKERLQRTLELFKQLKLQSDLEKLVKSFEDLAQREQELQHQTQQNEQAKSQRQQNIEESQKLKERIESLSENAPQRQKKTVSEYQEQAGKQLEELIKEMETAADSGSENETQNEQEQNQQNQDFGQAYQQLANMTKNLMQAMSQQQQQFNIAALKYVLYALLTLSAEQEDITILASAAQNRSQAFVEVARTQLNVESIFSILSDSLYKLSTESPQFSNSINKKKMEVSKQLSLALEQMAERNQGRSSVASRQALGGINEIAFMIANLLEQLQNAQSGGGSNGGMSLQQMMEQLQQSGEQQQQLNQQIQEMINDIQGERLSQDQMQRLNELAKTQNRIRKQLQELQQSGTAGDRIGSELQRMIDEMEETINDLRGGNTDPTLVQRQQNILSRMLESEKALQKRDEEETREGRTAGETEYANPPELTLEELEKQIRKRLNDPNFTKYSEDYQRLIEKYFELLRNLQNQEKELP